MWKTALVVAALVIALPPGWTAQSLTPAPAPDSTYAVQMRSKPLPLIPHYLPPFEAGIPPSASSIPYPERLAMLAEAGHPLFAHVRNTQDELTWYAGTIHAFRPLIAWPSDQTILATTDAGDTLEATQILTLAAGRSIDKTAIIPLRPGGWAGFPADIEIEHAAGNRLCHLFAAFPRNVAHECRLSSVLVCRHAQNAAKAAGPDRNTKPSPGRPPAANPQTKGETP